MSEAQAVSNRFADGVLSDVKRPGRTGAEARLKASPKEWGQVELMDFFRRRGGEGRSPEREVVPRGPGGGDGLGSRKSRGQEGCVLAEEDGPVEGLVAHRGDDQSGRSKGARVVEGFDPGSGPIRVEQAGILGEHDDLAEGLIEAQASQTRDAAGGRRENCGDVLSRPGNARDPLGSSDDDHLEVGPPGGLSPEGFERPGDGRP
ncbi:MAG: hypothetical protein NVSMB9_05600 [Isosphaeraceae bacterium]